MRGFLFYVLSNRISIELLLRRTLVLQQLYSTIYFSLITQINTENL
jgi:hypothetical protein